MRSAIDAAIAHGIDVRKKAKALLLEDPERREVGYASSIIHSLRTMQERSSASQRRKHAQLIIALASAYFECEQEEQNN